MSVTPVVLEPQIFRCAVGGLCGKYDPLPVDVIPFCSGSDASRSANVDRTWTVSGGSPFVLFSRSTCEPDHTITAMSRLRLYSWS